MIQANLPMKQKQTRPREQMRSCQSREGWGRAKGGLEAWVSRCKLLHTEWVNNKVLLYSPGNFIQYPVINHHGLKKKSIDYIYNQDEKPRAQNA